MKNIYPHNCSALSFYSPLNGYDVRTFNLDRGKHGDESFHDGFKPWLDEPGFNGDDNTWMFTSHGDSEYHANPDIMTIGCSITSSVAMPREFSWPYLIQSHTGKTLNNCSRSASGAAYQVQAALSMIREFGKPRIVYALFPDLYRGLVVPSANLDSRKSIQKHLLWSSLIGAYVAPEEAIAIYNDDNSGQSKKYKVYTYKDFQGLKYLIPSEWCIQQNLEAIHMFSMFCQISDIELKFCSWSSPTNKELGRLQMYGFAQPRNKYDRQRSTDYVYNQITDFNFSDPDEWPVPLDETCGHRPSSSQQEKIWALGVDNYHPGIHPHIHFAEHFLGATIDSSVLDCLPKEIRVADQENGDNGKW